MRDSPEAVIDRVCRSNPLVVIGPLAEAIVNRDGGKEGEEERGGREEGVISKAFAAPDHAPV